MRRLSAVPRKRKGKPSFSSRSAVAPTLSVPPLRGVTDAAAAGLAARGAAAVAAPAPAAAVPAAPPPDAGDPAAPDTVAAVRLFVFEPLQAAAARAPAA